MKWRKSSYSNGTGECVELARGATSIQARDSKNPDGPRIAMSRRSLARLLGEVKRGERDL
jgi:hypothetical protein